MPAPDRDIRRTVATLLVLGGLTWLPARIGVMTTWDDTWLGLGYTGWNRLTLVPLSLLLCGAVLSVGVRGSRAEGIGWRLAAAGFAASWVGVVLEFVVGGGLQSGPRELAAAGWSVYLLGTAISAVGALVLAAAFVRARPAMAVSAAVAGAAVLAWPPLIAADLQIGAVASQLVTGLAWAVVGALASAPRPPATSRGSAAASRGRRRTPPPTATTTPR